MATRPAWYNEEIHSKVCDILNAGNKLQAVKYLCDESTNHGTRNEFGLKEMKELCDEISPPMFRVPAPNEIPLHRLEKYSHLKVVIDHIVGWNYTDVNKRRRLLENLLAHVPDNVLEDFLDEL
jgi:hypothetical protein